MRDVKKGKVESISEASKEAQKEDYYFENGLVVFTEAYHIKRGHCCESGCRHCPYGFKKKDDIK